MTKTNVVMCKSEVDVHDEESVLSILRALVAVGCVDVSAGLYGASVGEDFSIRFSFEIDRLAKVKLVLGRGGFEVTELEEIDSTNVEVYWAG